MNIISVILLENHDQNSKEVVLGADTLSPTGDDEGYNRVPIDYKEILTFYTINIRLAASSDV